MQYVGLTKAAIGEIMNNSDLQTLLRRQGFTRLIISNGIRMSGPVDPK